MKTLVMLFIILLGCVHGYGTPTAVVIHVQNGILIGADSVDVGGTSYDVRFAAQTCVELYGGCELTENLPFILEADARLASQALLTQVINGPFETALYLIKGCETGRFNESSFCEIYTPFALFTFRNWRGEVYPDSTYVQVADASLSAATSAHYEVVTVVDSPNDFPMGPPNTNGVTWAAWVRSAQQGSQDPSSPPQNAITAPEPSNLAVLLIAAAGLFCHAYRTQQRQVGN